MVAASQAPDAGRAPDHVVQLFESDETLLVRNVGRYLADGLRAGSVMVVASQEHAAAFVDELRRAGARPDRAASDGRLVVLDAGELLDRFLVDGYPHADRFDSVVGALVREVRQSSSSLRIYGEMVALLWKAKQFPAAIRLEQLWNKLQKTVSFELFCSYPIDVFADEFDTAVVGALLHAHTHLLETATEGALEAALTRAIAEVLGVRPFGFDRLVKERSRRGATVLPKAEAIILWLRTDVPDQAPEILARARRYHRALTTHR